MPGRWCWDPYAKECDLCDTIVGRFGLLKDGEGVRHVAWWPHQQWDGRTDQFRCQDHTAVQGRSG